ncbi:CheY-like superfamily [Aspergillus varians]
MHILIVEDNRVNQKVTQRLLQRLGCTFAIAWNGQEALDYLSSPPTTCPRPDIILMDLAMPIMSGHQALSIIRSQPPFTTDPVIPTIPIIALSASQMPGETQRLAGLGFDDSIPKPIRSERLRKVILYWSGRRVVPRQGGPPGVPVPRSGNWVPVSAAAVWGPMPLRAFRGPRSLL